MKEKAALAKVFAAASFIMLLLVLVSPAEIYTLHERFSSSSLNKPLVKLGFKLTGGTRQASFRQEVSR